MACDDLSLLPPESVSREGCLIFKGNVFSAQLGSCATLDWTLRNRDGNAIDLSPCQSDSDLTGDASVSAEDALSEPGKVVKARFMLQDVPSTLVQIGTQVNDPAQGRVAVPVPQTVLDRPGLWTVEVGLVQVDNNRLIYADRGVVSVEQSLWMSETTFNGTGPVTLADIRIFLRDSPQENELLRAYEYDAVEIMAAVLRPVREWNETPPDIKRFSTQDFPWKEHWLRATVSFLLETAGQWYLRNKSNTVAAGLRISDRDKDTQYIQLANLYRDQWKQFILRKKVEINARNGFAKIPGAMQPGQYFNW
jgi:hypothetical protein